jgi:hypothetical protein
MMEEFTPQSSRENFFLKYAYVHIFRLRNSALSPSGIQMHKIKLSPPKSRRGQFYNVAQKNEKKHRTDSVVKKIPFIVNRP